jgi:hypothetical protein
MKHTLQKQLKQYTKMAGAALAAAPLAAQAQAVYTDLEPDVTIGIGDGAVAIDINGDGTDDLVMAIIQTSATGSGGASLYQNIAAVSGYGIGAFAGSTAVFGANTFYFPGAYNAGASISSGLDWASNSAFGSMNYLTFYTNGAGSSSSFYGGNWVNQSDKYLAARFNAGSDLHYAWVRMDVGAPDPSNFITIKDFAFESQVEVGIDAGDTIGATPSVIPTTDAPELTCYSHGNQIILRSQDAEWSEGQIEVIDMAGRTIASEAWTGGDAQLQLNTADGLYHAILRNNNGAVATRKVFVGRLR